MKARRMLIAAAALVVAVVLQTSLFVRFRPFDAAPALVVLVVIAYSRHLQAEYAMLFGFGAGLLQDLLAESPLGLWALVLASVAFTVVRLRGRLEDELGLFGPFVFAVTLGALTTFALLGTIFGEKTLADVGVLRKILLPAVYNVLLGVLILPLTTKTLGLSRRSREPFSL